MNALELEILKMYRKLTPNQQKDFADLVNLLSLAMLEEKSAVADHNSGHILRAAVSDFRGHS